MRVVDFQLVPQKCTQVTVAFDDHAVAEFFEDQVDQGRAPDQFARIWCHTHPGDSAEPSGVDVETFDRVFGNCDWAVMFILAKHGETFAELHWKHGGPASMRQKVEVDYSTEFAGTEFEQWEAEYHSAVRDLDQSRLRRNERIVLCEDEAFLNDYDEEDWE